MPYYRVTYDGYVEGEYASEEEAKKDLLACLDPDYIDGVGRTRENMLSVETWNPEKGKWE
jgi:hypothetical protein